MPPSPSLNAANSLMALSWPGLIAQIQEDAARDVQALDGTRLASGGNNGGEIRWSFSLKVDKPSIDIDLAEPPGLSRLGLDGFTVRAPLRRSWGFKLKAEIDGNAKVWVSRTGTNLLSWSPRLSLGIQVAAIRVVAGADLDASNPERPKVQQVILKPELAVRGDGLIPFSVPFDDFTVTVEGGGVTLTKRVTSLSVDLGGLAGKLTADLAVRMEPTDRGVEVLSERLGFLRVHLSLKGDLRVTLKRVGQKTMPFSLSTTVNIPAPEALTLAFGQLDVDLPRSWGEGHPRGATPLPPPNVDFAAAAAECEAAIMTHLPFGAVLAIDRRPVVGPPAVIGLPAGIDLRIPGGSRRGGGGRTGSRPIPGSVDVGVVVPTYAVELDSAIWTTHYLAAEAFRYASQPGPDALERVRFVLDGVQRLFDVTTHAAVKGNRRVGVRERGIFARTALPRDHQPTYTDGPLEGRFAYYEFAEGGWHLSVGGRREHFATYADAEDALRGPMRGVLGGRSAEISPVGRVWHGAGCGGECEADHPISRDQYLGVFFGLFCAHQFVPDGGVRERAAALLTSALGFLLRHGWNAPLPPEQRICTSFIGEFHQQLAFLAIGKIVNPTEFGSVYNEYRAAAPAAWLPMWGSSLDPIPKYYKFNLQHAPIIPALLAEPSGATREQYMVAYRMLRRATAHHRNAYFNLARILVEPPASRAAVAGGPSGSNAAITLRDEVKSLLADWLDRREKVRGETGLPRNDVPDPAFQAALWPDFVKRYAKLDPSGSKPYVATFALPPNGRIGRGMDFMWQRDPFDVAIASTRRRGDPPPTEEEIRENGAGVHQYREGPGVDYLLAYWLAVHLGVLP